VSFCYIFFPIMVWCTMKNLSTLTLISLYKPSWWCINKSNFGGEWKKSTYIRLHNSFHFKILKWKKTARIDQKQLSEKRRNTSGENSISRWNIFLQRLSLGFRRYPINKYLDTVREKAGSIFTFLSFIKKTYSRSNIYSIFSHVTSTVICVHTYICVYFCSW
jgi:hypothetical protein